jgi:hypothetical protein
LELELLDVSSVAVISSVELSRAIEVEVSEEPVFPSTVTPPQALRTEAPSNRAVTATVLGKGMERFTTNGSPRYDH